MSWLRSGSSFLVSGLLFAVATTAAAVADATATRVVRAHTTFLSDDLAEGRGAGTRGYQIAAHYVAAQFARLGLRPAGDDGTFFQPVRLLESVSDLEASQLTMRHGASALPLPAVDEFVARPTPGHESSEVSGPVVFVGFGVHAPESGYSDFGDNLDLTGKIALILSGAPPALSPNARAHYSNWTQKATELTRRGAIGVIIAATRTDEQRYPWAFTIGSSRFPRMRLVAEDGSIVEGFPALRVTASVSRAGAAKLFAHAPATFEEARTAAERSEPQAFPLAIEVTLGAKAAVREIVCHNVLAWLPGADAALQREPVVVTSHLDHLGIGPAVDGDTLYNGTLDNAIGVGMMLAAAEKLAQQPPARRPVLFAALTAEEKGLLGAHHLAGHPPARVQRYAANVNLDYGGFFEPVESVIAWGSEHSTLGALVERVANRRGLNVKPDPYPEETIFVRSDQYAFVRAGVPAVYLAPAQPTAPGEKRSAEEAAYFKTRYHKPGDDLSQPIEWSGAGALSALAADVVQTIANEEKAPSWMPGDFFGERFGAQRQTRSGGAP